jgi:hypothetical protein
MGNMVVVKISDISELMTPKEQTKILENQLVRGLSNLLSDSVKNSDSDSAGWQEWAHNTPNTPHQCQAAYGTHVGVAFWRGASTRCGTGHTDYSQTSVDTAALPALSALAWS